MKFVQTLHPINKKEEAAIAKQQIDINPIMASYASANMGRSFSGGINVAFISSESYFLQQQLAPPTPRRHAIFIFLVPLLLKFLQLQCQGQVASQFETHPKTMFVAITSLIVYFFAYDAELRSSSTEDYGPVVLSRVKEVSGLLCLLSFALVLFPDSARVILYLLYVLFLATKFVHCKLQMLWNWLHQKVIGRFPRERFVRRAPNRRFWFVTPASANGRYLLPLYQ
ncbi:unnamed protein product [Camellia sinensis]